MAKTDIKAKAVKKLGEDIRKSKTIMLVSIKSIPSSQFQKIKRDLRAKANVHVVKKNIMLRAIDESDVPELASLKEHVQSDCAVALSEEDAFQLAGWLVENKNPLAAKAGQIAEEDIIVEAGPTELLPGPAISELGAIGLKVMVEDGKIAIREAKAVVKKGEKVSAEAASILQKLGMKPFLVCLSPIALYDSANKKIYLNIRIDKKKALQDLSIAQSKAVGFAVGIAYACKQTIGRLLGKANAQFNALDKLTNKI